MTTHYISKRSTKYAEERGILNVNLDPSEVSSYYFTRFIYIRNCKIR